MFRPSSSCLHSRNVSGSWQDLWWRLNKRRQEKIGSRVTRGWERLVNHLLSIRKAEYTSAAATLLLCLEAPALLSLGECSHQKHRDDHTGDAIPLAASQVDSLIPGIIVSPTVFAFIGVFNESNHYSRRIYRLNRVKFNHPDCRAMIYPMRVWESKRKKWKAPESHF